jgi:hypothetical protein
LAPPRLCRARRAEVRAEQAEDLANELRGRLDIAGKAADQARAEAHEAHQVAGALRQADATRRAQGRWARLRAAWRGE